MRIIKNLVLGLVIGASIAGTAQASCTGSTSTGWTCHGTYGEMVCDGLVTSCKVTYWK